MSTLNSIPTDFELNPDQIISHQNFENYFEILTDLNSQEKTIFEADSTDISQLYSLLGNSTGNIKAMVRNLLVAIDTLTHNEPYYLPDILKSYEINAEYNRILNAEKPSFLNVHPNPANDYIIIEYKLQRVVPAVIKITNLTGNLISTIKTVNNHDQVVLDTRDWKSGWYLATLQVNGKSIESTNFQ